MIALGALVLTGLLVGSASAGPVASDPTLKAWFKADAITGVLDGASLSSWVNSNLGGNDATTVGIQPVYEQGDGSINNRPYVKFNNSPLTTASGLGITGDIATTAFIVYKTNVNPAFYGAFGWGNVYVARQAFAFAPSSSSGRTS